MKCTACWSPIVYMGGENTKDHYCNNMQCPARVETLHYSYVSVEPNWWFAARYSLPFKCQGSWYCTTGPHFNYRTRQDPYRTTTSLHKLEFQTNGLHLRKEVWKIPYMALPVNEDFNREFAVLHSKFDRYLNKLILLQ